MGDKAFVTRKFGTKDFNFTTKYKMLFCEVSKSQYESTIFMQQIYRNIYYF